MKRPFLVEYTTRPAWPTESESVPSVFVNSRHSTLRLAEIALRWQAKQLGARQYQWRIRHAQTGEIRPYVWPGI